MIFNLVNRSELVCQNLFNGNQQYMQYALIYTKCEFLKYLLDDIMIYFNIIIYLYAWSKYTTCII